MSKKQKQRTKGNVRPSSSGQAAELLAKEGGGHVGFVGFGSMSGDLGYVPTSVGFEDQDAGLDTDFRMVLRKLSKRDVVTKLKAIQEFQGLCSEKEEDAIVSLLPHWPRLYNRLSMDHDKRVREATQQMFIKVVSRVKRNLAPHLKAIMGCWLMAQNDPYAPAGSGAKVAFRTAFTSPEKQGNAVVFCKTEVLQLYKDNLFKETPETLSDPKSFSKEEQTEKYLRVVSSSLLALRELISLLPQGQLEGSKEELSTILSEDRLWKFVKHQSPEIRGAMYSLLGTLCSTVSSILTPYLPKLCPALLASMNETDPLTVGPLWDGILRLISCDLDCWKFVNMRKAVLPKLWSVLRHGGSGCATTIYPHLLPLLSHLPHEVKGQDEAFYKEFFNNFREGLSCKSVSQISSENTAVLKSFMECLRYSIAQNLSSDNASVHTHLIDQQLMPLLKSSLSKEGKAWSVVTIYQQTGALLNYLYKQKDDEEKGSPAQQVLEYLWSGISALCVDHVTSISTNQEAGLNNVAMIVAVLKNPNTAEIKKTGVIKRRSKGVRIRFALEEEEEGEGGEKEDPSTSTGLRTVEEFSTEPSIQHPQLPSIVSDLIQSSFHRVKDSLPHLNFLAQLVKTFPTQSTIRTLLKSASVNTTDVNITGVDKTDENAAGANASCEPHTGSDPASIQVDAPSTDVRDKDVAESKSSSENDKDQQLCRTSEDVKSTEDAGEEIEESKKGKLDAKVEENEGVEKLDDVDDDLLPLRCIFSFLLPWLLDVEKGSEFRKQEKVLRLEAVLDMTVAVLLTINEENRILVVDAVCLKAETSQLLHLTICKMRDKPELSWSMDAWLQSDLFGEKLLSIQDELCRLTLEGELEHSSVGWKLISLALSSGKHDEPLIGTTYAELLLVGFYHALTRPDVVATATQCISFICDVTTNFFSAVKGCIHLSSSTDLLLAIFQLECKNAHNLSGSLKEKVRQTWVQGVQSLVKQTGGLLTNQGLLVRTTQWIKQTLNDKEGNVHQFEELGASTSAFLAAILDGLPSNHEDSCQDVLKTLLESVLPSDTEWDSQRRELANQWISSAVIGQQMTQCDLSPLTSANKTNAPQALKLTLFVSTLMSELIKNAFLQENEDEGGEEDEVIALKMSGLPWQCEALQSAIIEVMYMKEWCQAMTGFEAAPQKLAAGTAVIASPPDYCFLYPQTFGQATDGIWEHLTQPEWQQLFGHILDRSLKSGGLWSYVLYHFIDNNFKHNGGKDQINIWQPMDTPTQPWLEISSEEILQTVERLVPHFSDRHCQELAECHAGMLMSCEGDQITSLCGNISNLAILIRCITMNRHGVLPDIALSSLRQLQHWREKSNSVFLFSGEELEGASSELLCLNIKMVQLVTCIVEKIPEELESHDWDFILCSLVAWVQACSENTSNVQSSSVLAATLFAATSDLLSSTSRLFGHSDRSAKLPSGLLTEWSEFFSDGAYSVFLPAFMQFLEQESVWNAAGMDLTPLLYALCEAAAYTPTEQLKGHCLPTRLQPGSTRHVPDTLHTLLNHLVALLTKPYRPVQMAAFNMLQRVMPEFARYDEEYLQVKNKTQADDEDEAPSILPPTGLQKLLDSSTAFMEALLQDIPVGECTIVEPGSEAYMQTSSYLLAWKLYLTIFRAATMEVRAQYSSYLKQTKGIHSLLESLFCLMPEDPTLERSTTPSKGSQVTMFSKPPDLTPKASHVKVNEVQHLACSVFFSLLQDVPAIARQWWTLQDRRIAPYVDRFTTKFVSPLLCAEEIRSVQENPSTAENMTVKARLSTREVIATYSMQELNIEMMITLPANHPLGPIEVDNRRKVAVGTSQWRQWTLMLTTFLTHQNGSIMEGLNLWRINADKRFEGIEDCMICFSVIHGGNCSLPKLTCKTCKKRFHSACLYKWFSTSTQSSCPLCRSPF
ncbi:E3 ubiquitin-protein ligase listerin-like [Lytechinus variegatus]|uniref:E3 ubiquitin-protein ligase listerin-like n=1 Tax=Lytechinus variegatus TaxID=7654 RepID=UPI001BB2C044|nr:E3 ubiquitin-protein ligase listerin-like [Lytechinus variegatus]